MQGSHVAPFFPHLLSSLLSRLITSEPGNPDTRGPEAKDNIKRLLWGQLSAKVAAVTPICLNLFDLKWLPCHHNTWPHEANCF